MSSNNTASATTTSCGHCGATQAFDGTALRSCGKCKFMRYFSRDCQVAHWNKHKEGCKTNGGVTAAASAATNGPKSANVKPSTDSTATCTGDGTIYTGEGIRIHPMRVNDNGEDCEGYAFVPIPKVHPSILQHCPSASISVSRPLGFPLRMFAVPGDNAHLINNQANSLGIDVDPNSPEFGQIRWEHLWPATANGPLTSPRPMGPMVFVREDEAGRELHMEQVSTLVKYVREGLKSIRHAKARKAKGKPVDTTGLVERLLPPAAFAAFFEREKTAGMLIKPETWVGAECPVKVAEASRDDGSKKQRD